MHEADEQRKLCFVTIGATAAFDSLIKAVLQPDFLQALATNGYTALRVQHGKNRALYQSLVADVNWVQEAQVGLEINGFDFNQEGLGAEMRDAKDGVVISHAGMALGISLKGSRSLRIPNRIRLHPRCAQNFGASDCCAQLYLAGQSPGGTSRRDGGARIRGARSPGVSQGVCGFKPTQLIHLGIYLPHCETRRNYEKRCRSGLRKVRAEMAEVLSESWMMRWASWIKCVTPDSG